MFFFVALVAWTFCRPLQAKQGKDKEKRQEEWHEQERCAACASTAQDERKNGHHNGEGHHEASSAITLLNKDGASVADHPHGWIVFRC